MDTRKSSPGADGAAGFMGSHSGGVAQKGTSSSWQPDALSAGIIRSVIAQQLPQWLSATSFMLNLCSLVQEMLLENPGWSWMCLPPPKSLQPVHEDVAGSWFIGQESSWFLANLRTKAEESHPSPPGSSGGGSSNSSIRTTDAISPGSLSPFCSEQPVFPGWLLGTCVHQK